MLSNSLIPYVQILHGVLIINIYLFLSSNYYLFPFLHVFPCILNCSRLVDFQIYEFILLCQA
jgi:hypothetical protein